MKKKRQTKLLDGPVRYQWVVVYRSLEWGVLTNAVTAFRFDSQKLSFEIIRSHYYPQNFFPCIEDYVDLVKAHRGMELYPNIVSRLEGIPFLR